jgi:HlyD family secretion protein
MPKKPFSGKRNTIIIAAVAIAVAGGALTAWMTMRGKTVTVTTEKAFRKEIVHVVTATGKIEPEIEAAMSPDVSGEIIELPVSEGDQVRKSDLLFKIQPDVYINQVEQGRAQLNLSKSQSLEAKARKLKSEDDFRKAALLFLEKLISQTDYLAAKTNAETAKASYEASLFAIQQNRSLLDQNEERLRKTVVRAPIDGTVIALKSKLGERVVGTGQFQGTEVLGIANLDSMQVVVEVNENDIVNVGIGNPVAVTVDAFGDRQFGGIVHEISNSAITKESGTQEEVTNFSVKIRILNHNRLLKPGMSATADIETKRVPNALVVPIQSVTIRDGNGAAVSDTTGKKNGEVVEVRQNSGTEGTEGVFIVKGNKVFFRKIRTGTTTTL